MDTRNLEKRTTWILVDYLTKENRILETVDEDNRPKIIENINELYLTIEDKLDKLKTSEPYYFQTLNRLKGDPEDKGRQGALESVLKDIIDFNVEFKKNLSDLLAKIEGEPDYFVFFSCRHVDRCTRYNKNPAKIKDGCQESKDNLPCYYKNAIQKSFKEKYLFNWEDVGENYYNALKWYLQENLGIEWVKTASIKRINDQTIKISNTKNSLELKLNDEKTMVKLHLDNGKTETFIVKNENDKHMIYKINKIDIRFPTRDFKSIDDALKKMDSVNGNNCFFVLNSHRPINEFTYFQLGYAFAKGIEVLRLNDGLEQFLPDDMKLSSKIFQTENFYEFITKIQEFSHKKEYENRKCRKDYWNRPEGCWPTEYDNGSMQIPIKN